MPVSYGTETLVTSTGFNSLAAAATGASATIDNLTDLFHALTVRVTLTATGAPTAGGQYEVWLQSSSDGTTWPTAGGVFLGAIAAPASAIAVIGSFETDAEVATLGRYHRIAVVNNASTALAATGNSLYVRGKKAI